jgi:ATP-binding cassette subfamily C exporter for protease/lipase
MITGFLSPRSELASVLYEFRKEFIVVGIFSSIANLLMLTPSLYMLQVYDRAMLSRSELTLIAVSILALFLYVTLAFCEWIRGRLIVRIGACLDQRLSSRIFQASFQERLNLTGQAPSQANSDLTLLRQWLTGAAIFAFFDLPWTPIYIGVMFLLHTFLGWLSIVFVIVLCLLAWQTSRLTTSNAEALQAEETDLNVLLHSKLRNADVIEAHGMLPGLRNRWWKKQLQMLLLTMSAGSVENRMTSISKELRVLMQSLSLGAGALLVIQDELGMGSMIVASMIMGRVTAPIDSIASSWKGFVNARSAYTRLEALLAAHPERSFQVKEGLLQDEIVLRDLVATAPRRPQPILKGLNARFPLGQIYTVLGPSGSGKSTLLRALLGVWSQQSGQVLFDGLDVSQYDRDWLGSQVGYLPQDIELFSGSVAENIARLGEVDSEKVIDASRQTGMHDTILHFPKGYDTQIGKGGSFMSGGQRQRVALSRAIYGNPSLIVLDEPDANLDDAGQAALGKMLESLKARGATVFLVTHGKALIHLSDRIIAMRDGAIEHYGKRDEVLSAMKGPAPNLQSECKPQIKALELKANPT